MSAIFVQCVQRALDLLVVDGKVTEKVHGRQKVYFANQVWLLYPRHVHLILIRWLITISSSSLYTSCICVRTTSPLWMRQSLRRWIAGLLSCTRPSRKHLQSATRRKIVSNTLPHWNSALLILVFLALPHCCWRTKISVSVQYTRMQTQCMYATIIRTLFNSLSSTLVSDKLPHLRRCQQATQSTHCTS